jgi:hypothetical protein
MSSYPENFSKNADNRRPGSAVCTENLNADVMVVKSAKEGNGLMLPVCVGSQDSAQMRLA